MDSDTPPFRLTRASAVHRVSVVLPVTNERGGVRRPDLEPERPDDGEVGGALRARLPLLTSRVGADDDSPLRVPLLQFFAHLFGVGVRELQRVEDVVLVHRPAAYDRRHGVDVEVHPNKQLAAEVFDRFIHVAERVGLVHELRVHAPRAAEEVAATPDVLIDVRVGQSVVLGFLQHVRRQERIVEVCGLTEHDVVSALPLPEERVYRIVGALPVPTEPHLGRWRVPSASDRRTQ